MSNLFMLFALNTFSTEITKLWKKGSGSYSTEQDKCEIFRIRSVKSVTLWSVTKGSTDLQKWLASLISLNIVSFLLCLFLFSHNFGIADSPWTAVFVATLIRTFVGPGEGVDLDTHGFPSCFFSYGRRSSVTHGGPSDHPQAGAPANQ